MTTLAAQLARLPRAELEKLTDEQAAELLYDWSVWARPEQMTPAGNWNVWLILAGRGYGKTRTAAEDVKAYGLKYKKSRIAIVAPTFADARDTCIEGESGLLNILPKDKIATWNRSIGELYLTNGTKYKLFSAEDPDRLRGPQHHRAWFDEPCAAKYPSETWDQLLFGLRLKGPRGQSPQAVVTTTPKPIKWLKELLARKDIHVTRGNTFDNAANLSSVALETLKQRYAGTRLGRQELYAELLDDVEGALWKREEMIEVYRVTSHPELLRVVVAIDPAVTDQEESAETGIVVAGIDGNGHGYVLDDKSLHASPLTWASEAVTAYHKYRCDRIIGEQNNGGQLVESNVRTVDKQVSYKQVYASRGKYTRAEPIASFYEQGKVHHVGMFPLLEDQMCQWEPLTGQKSPDRLDALVWALTELMGGGELSAAEQVAAMKRRVELSRTRTAAPAWPGGAR
jgi:phage terminase large subunit-like protein